MQVKVSKTKNRLYGQTTVPADKSISHRSIMFGSLAKGKTLVKNFLTSADCISTLNIMKTLGVEINFLKETELEIISEGKFIPPQKPLDCGNSGTTTRLISGILARCPFSSTLIGDESLSSRPMKRIITPLSMMGADIKSQDFKLPLTINGKTLNGITYNSPLASAQVKSCILLAGLQAEGTTKVIEPYQSRNHTELMLEYMGANIKYKDNITEIIKSELIPQNIEVVGDISSAAYLIAAGLIVPNSEIIIKNVGLNPTRTGIIDVVKKMGGNIEILNETTVSNEKTGDLKIKYSKLKGTEISKDIIPRLIDEIPIIAVLASLAEGTTTIKDAQDLRNKESDRIKTVATELKKIGANIEETPDGLIIEGKKSLNGNAEINTYHDHRLAMSLYIAGLICEKEILINDFEWTKISFPNFEEKIISLFS